MWQLPKRLFLFSFLIMFASATSAQQLEEWVYEENIDPMTDENSSYAAIINGRKELIAVRCDGDNSFNIIVGVGEYLGSDSPPVTYRIDKQPAVNADRWNLSTTGTLMFVPDSKLSEIKEGLLTGQNIIFQVTDFRGSKPYAKFSLSGSSAAISQLACMK